MSFHKLPLDLSPEALDDRISIVHDSALRWGEAQARIYHASINDAFDTVCRHPKIAVLVTTGTIIGINHTAFRRIAELEDL